MNLRPFRRVLVANRGEIAVRVIRGCHEHGLQAVAVYSEPDANALHVRMADAAFLLGPAASSESYLRGDKVLAAARAMGADAIHPGYGFLSENADFARQVIDAGLVWIGPPPAAIEAMGSKTAARRTMSAAGVPVVPGTLEAVRDEVEAREIANRMGYPVMLKAVGGGGGKGMRRVYADEEMSSSLSSARSEGLKSFKDDAVYIEKLIERGRHVEIQVMADGHGNVIYVFERDCSVQRRHQKVFEEAPSPALDPDVRAAMGDVACRAARAVGYVGAGTCEFLLAADKSFYFLEMNTRLQVEHPITEMISGIDLVRLQLRAAAGERLPYRQEDLRIHGHAVECRIYAEDPRANFRPAPGPLHVYREPGGPFVRCDSGVVEGMEVPIHYDPMVAKLVVWGHDRAEALERAERALREYRIVGIPTSIPFFLMMFQDADFRAGQYDTGFITPELVSRLGHPSEAAIDDAARVAAIAAFLAQERPASSREVARESSPWRRAIAWPHLNRGW
jgi:acetyl-CoA carboxylase biotin carboxylase subunit